MTLYDSMLAAADPSQVEGLSRFFKTGPGQYGEGDKFLGIKVPVTRSIVKACWKSTDFEDLERCIGSEYHEIRLAALLVLVEIFSHAKQYARNEAPCHFEQCHATCHSERSEESTSHHTACHSERSEESTSRPTPCHSERSEESLRSRCINFYLSHTGRINNWDLVDLSCYPLLGVWLLDKDRSILYDLARSGKTIWEQRIGIVSTMTFIRHGQLADTFAIADILLHHQHDLIHKAVGWLLREAGKRDRDALEAYLQGQPGICHSELSEESASRYRQIPRYLQMPRTMLRYAIEKFPESERRRYLKGEMRG